MDTKEIRMPYSEYEQLINKLKEFEDSQEITVIVQNFSYQGGYVLRTKDEAFKNLQFDFDRTKERIERDAKSLYEQKEIGYTASIDMLYREIEQLTAKINKNWLTRYLTA